MTGTKRAVLLLSLVLPLLLSGCEKRVPAYSPRIDPTPDHLSARTSADCLSCHDAPSLPRDHTAGDLCRRCHRICKGRYE